MRQLDTIGLVALILVLVGGINWGLVGLFNVNIVTALFGFGLIGRTILILVGAAAAYLIYYLFIDKEKKVI